MPLGATTTTSLGATTESQSEQAQTTPSQTLPSTNYSCTACQISFPNGQEQRTHMKEAWHVYNIKRRIAELPPIPQHTFESKIETHTETHISTNSESPQPTFSSKISPHIETNSSSPSTSSDSSVSDTEGEQTLSPFHCLFCPTSFPPSPTALPSNLTHMQTSHGLFIPDPDKVSDMASFVGYLATEIREWRECLYCGATKDSTLSIQSHMRDKGHCQLNFDREPELRDFWENYSQTEDGDGGGSEVENEEQGQDQPTKLSTTELRIPSSGKTIFSCQNGPPRPIPAKARKTRASTTPTTRTITSGSDPDPSPSSSPPQPPHQSTLTLSRREEMSIAGISTQQRQALVLAEKKAQRSEAVARRAQEWVYAKSANKQEFDQIDTKGKWGKQNHKLLPR